MTNREIDVAVAKAMGWQIRYADRTYEGKSKWNQTWGKPKDQCRNPVAYWCEFDKSKSEFNRWKPSTSISDAIKLLVEIGKLRGGPHNFYKPVVRLEYYEHDGQAHCAIGRCKGMDDIVVIEEAWADGGPDEAAMAMAICLSFLKAKGVDIENGEGVS